MLIIDYYISSKRRKSHDGDRGQGQGQGFHLQLLTASHVAMNMQITVSCTFKPTCHQ